MIQFTLAVFAVNLVGGAAIALGPGEALLALVPKPGATARYIAETVAGVVMLVAAAVLWRRRKVLARRELPTPRSERPLGHPARPDDRRGGAAHRLPVLRGDRRRGGSGLDPVRQLVLLALYNVAFVLPLHPDDPHADLRPRPGRRAS